MQLFGLLVCIQSALRVLGEVFAHHQEYLTVFTASNIAHLPCCQQQYRWTISETVNTVKCSLWWAKTSPETCRANWVQINKLKKLHLVSHQLRIILAMHGHTNIRIRISRFHAFSTWPSAVYSLHQKKGVQLTEIPYRKASELTSVICINDVCERHTRGNICDTEKNAELQGVALQGSVQEVGVEVSYFVDTTVWNSSQFGHWIQCIKCSMTSSTIRRHKRLWKILLWKIHARKISGIERTAHC